MPPMTLTDEERAARLARLCTPDREHLATPWLIEHDGEPWTVASNGHVLLMMRGAFAERRSNAPNVYNILAKIKPVAALETTIGALRSWCGIAEEDGPLPDCKKCGNSGKVPCDECAETGLVECCRCQSETNCEACEGEGHIACSCSRGAEAWRPPDYGWVLGSLFNRRVIAQLSAAAPEGGVLLEWFAPDRPLHLMGDGWLGLVMPLRDIGLHPNAPAFADHRFEAAADV